MTYNYDAVTKCPTGADIPGVIQSVYHICKDTSMFRKRRSTVSSFYNLRTKIGINIYAPGEARTPDLRISLSVLTYKYDALTDCATGADVQGVIPTGYHICKDNSMLIGRRSTIKSYSKLR